MLRILGKFLGILLSVAVLSAFLMFAAANQQAVNVDVSPLPWRFEIPQFLLALVPFAAGLVIGAFYFLMDSLKNRRCIRRQEKRIAALENEVASLRLEEPEKQQRLHYLPPL